MEVFITLTTITHALLFMYDEYFLHKKRGLSRKEINSGIVDGLIFLILICFTIFTQYTPLLAGVYIFLSVISCGLIVKNEFFYPEQLTRNERLVHAALYVFHPLILFAFYISWKMDFFTSNIAYWMLQLGYLALAFKAVSFHIIYWNYVHDRPNKKRKRIKVD